jgi:hypothetical protein
MNKIKIKIFHTNEIKVNRNKKNNIIIKNLGLKQYVVFTP